MVLVRLHKILADAGVASRRKGEALILAGRVSVNNKIIKELGIMADPAYDRIRVDGKPLPHPAPKVYYLLYKPRGVITSLHDPEGRTTIKDLIPRIKAKIFPVGRLDYDAEGLLLLTNDGEMAMRLAHPRYRVPRTYLVKVKGVLTADEMARIEKGVMLDDGMSPAIKVNPIRRLQKNSVVRVTLHEGRNRVLKRTFEAIRHPVLRLKRIEFAFLTLEGLQPGDYRPLSAEEIERLRGLL
ncbi:MAG: rRNA pseudouridine synthase [Deltaproteobacteria bacterium]|nr:rRNA pseudouridine synthase [Deltaproteobacteria bacterium]